MRKYSHCKFCKESIVKGPLSKKFCNSTCKDKFHNWNNPRGKFKHLNDIEWYDDEDSWLGSPMQSGFFGHGQN